MARVMSHFQKLSGPKQKATEKTEDGFLRFLCFLLFGFKLRHCSGATPGQMSRTTLELKVTAPGESNSLRTVAGRVVKR